MPAILFLRRPKASDGKQDNFIKINNTLTKRTLFGLPALALVLGLTTSAVHATVYNAATDFSITTNGGLTLGRMVIPSDLERLLFLFQTIQQGLWLMGQHLIYDAIMVSSTKECLRLLKM
jgi:hypothetical protein